MPEMRPGHLNPLEAARSAIKSFLPESMPYLSRAIYARELPAWALLPVMTGVLEGGVVGVIVNHTIVTQYAPKLPEADEGSAAVVRESALSVDDFVRATGGHRRGSLQ